MRGPIDRPALLAIRDLLNQHEPLATAALDDFLTPRTLEVQYNDGLLSASQSRIDVQWTTRNDYKYHYTDAAGVDLRWGRPRTTATMYRCKGSNTTTRRRMRPQTHLKSRSRVLHSDPKHSSPGQ